LIKHNDNDHFILNLGGFHNFVRICRVLPASLTDLKPLIEDWVAFHKTASSTAQRARKNQRKRTAARRRETAQTKKREAELAAAEAERAAAEVEEAEDTEAGGNPLENDLEDPRGQAGAASEPEESDEGSEVKIGMEDDSEYLGPHAWGRKWKRRCMYK
jgi:hypothetical protein